MSSKSASKVGAPNPQGTPGETFGISQWTINSFNELSRGLLDIKEGLGRIEGKIDGISRRQDSADANISTLSTRIGRLNSKLLVASGFCAAIFLVAAFLYSTAMYLLKSTINESVKEALAEKQQVNVLPAPESKNKPSSP